MRTVHALLLAGLMSTSATAQDNRPELHAAGQVVVTGLSGRLNIRQAPDTGSAIVAQVQGGTIFDNGGCQTEGDRLWCRVDPPDGSGQGGWAAADYLTAVTLQSRAEAGAFDRIGRLDCTPAGAETAERCEFGAVCGSDGSAVAVFLTPSLTPILLWDGTALTAAEGAEVDAEIEADFARARLSGSIIDIPLSLLGGPAGPDSPSCGPPRQPDNG